jgi:hypothetical protein
MEEITGPATVHFEYVFDAQPLEDVGQSRSHVRVPLVARQCDTLITGRSYVSLLAGASLHNLSVAAFGENLVELLSAGS